MMKPTVGVFAALLALACMTPRAGAQTCFAIGKPSQCTEVVTFQFTAQRTLQVVVTPTTVNFGTPTLNDFNQGFTQAPVVQGIAINANTPWTLTLRATAATWTNVGPGSNAAKAPGDLQWATAVGGPYNATPGAALQIASGNATDLTTVSLFYRVLWNWAVDTPGTYTLPITFVITAP
jgi:hypothetical protein